MAQEFCGSECCRGITDNQTVDQTHDDRYGKRFSLFGNDAAKLTIASHLGRNILKEQNSRTSCLTWNTAPDVLTVEEAAMLVRVPRTGMYEAVAAGVVPSVNFGKRRTRISKAALAKVFHLAIGEHADTAAFSPSEA